MDAKTGAAPPAWMSDAPDQALLEAMQAGQVAALRVLYRRYGRLVYSLAFRVLGTTEEAEDVTQEIFLKLWQTCTYDPERGALSTYLSLMTRSRAIDRVRSRNAHRRLAQRWDAINAGALAENIPLEQASSGEQARYVRAALAELSPTEREILEIAYYEGLSQSQISRRLDIPLGTVKTRSRQALKKLRRLLQDLT